MVDNYQCITFSKKEFIEFMRKLNYDIRFNFRLTTDWATTKFIWSNGIVRDGTGNRPDLFLDFGIKPLRQQPRPVPKKWNKPYRWINLKDYPYTIYYGTTLPDAVKPISFVDLKTEFIKLAVEISPLSVGLVELVLLWFKGSQNFYNVERCTDFITLNGKPSIAFTDTSISIYDGHTYIKVTDNNVTDSLITFLIDVFGTRFSVISQCAFDEMIDPSPIECPCCGNLFVPNGGPDICPDCLRC